MGSTVIGAIPYPETMDPTTVPAHLRAAFEAIMQGIPPRFGSVAERTAAYATLGVTPATGALCYLASAARYETYNGTAWGALTGAWGDWVPTLSNLTQGSGTVVAQYRSDGETMDWFFRFVFGAGSAVGTDPAWSLPITPAAIYPVAEGFGSFPGRAHLVDAGTGARPGNLFHPTSTTVGVNFWNATPTITQVTATVPWTWAVNDSISAWGSCEI